MAVPAPTRRSGCWSREWVTTPSKAPQVVVLHRRWSHGSAMALATAWKGVRQPWPRVSSRWPDGTTVWAVATMRPPAARERRSRRIQRGKRSTAGLRPPKRPYSCWT